MVRQADSSTPPFATLELLTSEPTNLSCSWRGNNEIYETNKKQREQKMQQILAEYFSFSCSRYEL